jgi:hypothetical protein
LPAREEERAGVAYTWLALRGHGCRQNGPGRRVLEGDRGEGAEGTEDARTFSLSPQGLSLWKDRSGVNVMFIMPDFIHTPEEWIIWLLGSEFHDAATIDMLVQRTRYSREDTLSFIGVLERNKTVRVNRNARNAMIVDSIALVPNGKRLYEELLLRSGRSSG